MPSRSSAAWVCLGIGILSSVRVALVWDQLPARMASHYGASGQPNGFMPRDTFFLFYVGLFSAIITLFLMMPRVLSQLPRELVNIPHRDYWVTDERWPEALKRMGDWMAWFSVALAVLAAATLFLILRSNIWRQPLNNAAMLGILGGFLAFTLYWLVALYRAFRPPT